MRNEDTRSRSRLLGGILSAAMLLGAPLHAGAVPASARRYEEVKGWAAVPEAPLEISAVATDAEGNVFTLQRGPGKIVVSDAKGRPIRSWGEGAFPNGHAVRIDAAGNVWVTDRDLHQVFKYTPDGKLLMTLGTKGVAGDNASTASFNRPSDVAVGINGDIFVSDGESANSRVVRFSKDGKFLKAWGTKGARPGQLSVPHSIAIDSRGHLYVASRSNQRIEIFDQDGSYVGQITDIGSPAGLFIGKDDILYVTDGTKDHEGVNVMDIRSRTILGHIDGLPGIHMVSADRTGAIYAADLEFGVKKFVRK